MFDIGVFLQRTMLLERLLGVLTYLIGALAFSAKIKYSPTNKQVSKWLCWYLVFLCILAFFYIPAESADLTRLRLISNSFVNRYTFRAFIINVVITAPDPVSYLLLYLCQKTGIPGLLPMLCAFIFYGNVFHILNICIKRFSFSNRSVSTALLFVMAEGAFLEVISDVRCLVALSIVIRFFMDEVVDNKSIIISLPFYVISCLLHPAAIPLVGIRLFSLVFEKKKHIIYYFVDILGAIALIIIAFIFGGGTLQASLDKANNYISGNNTYSYSWEYIIGLFVSAIIIFTLWDYYRYYKSPNTPIRIVARDSTILLFIVFIYFGVYSVFHRFVIACSILVLPVFCDVIDRSIASQKYLLYKFSKLGIYFIFTLACLRGNLCGYKFFLLS